VVPGHASLLTPLGIREGSPWLAAGRCIRSCFRSVAFWAVRITRWPSGRAAPVSARHQVDYLDNLPRIYAAVWIGNPGLGADYAARSDLSAGTMAGLIWSVGIGSAVALPTRGT